MKYQIQNETLTVQIEALGAELYSIKGTDGTEYLWHRPKPDLLSLELQGECSSQFVIGIAE